MPLITGEEIFAAVLKDPEFSAQPNSVLEVIKPYILAIPEVLKDHLDKVVTLSTLMDAKIAFLSYCIDNEYVKKVIAAMPESALMGLSVEYVADLTQAMMSQAIEVFANVVKNIPAFLKSQGVSEEKMMASPNVALEPDVLKLYQAGTLTISDLLRLQPMVIVKNSK